MLTETHRDDKCEKRKVNMDDFITPFDTVNITISNHTFNYGLFNNPIIRVKL